MNQNLAIIYGSSIMIVLSLMSVCQILSIRNKVDIFYLKMFEEYSCWYFLRRPSLLVRGTVTKTIVCERPKSRIWIIVGSWRECKVGAGEEDDDKKNYKLWTRCDWDSVANKSESLLFGREIFCSKIQRRWWSYSFGYSVNLYSYDICDDDWDVF